MHDIRNDRTGGVVITTYAPIFREKLQKLEDRGKGDCTEAVNLRKTLMNIDHALRECGTADDTRRLLPAAD